MLCSLSTKLGPEDLEAITALEKELGNPVLAYSCREDLKPAALTPEKLARLQELERKLGLVLVAVQT